jgi:hypothetical protein
MIDSARFFENSSVRETTRLRIFAGLLVCLGPLLLIGGSRLLHAGPARTLIGESLAALVVIGFVAMLSLRNSKSSLERSRGWLRAGGAYLFVCALIIVVGLAGGGSAILDKVVPATPQVAAPKDTGLPQESAGASERAAGSPTDRASDADQIRKLLMDSEERSVALQVKYRSLLSPSYFVRLLAPENLADSTRVSQARLLLARLADSADSYASEVAAEGKAFIERIQSANLGAESKARYVKAVQQVELARQEDVGRWIGARRAAISTSLGILALVEQSDYAVVSQDDRIAFIDRGAGDRYDILVEQLREQDARARSALRAVMARDQQLRDALTLPN